MRAPHELPDEGDAFAGLIETYRRDVVLLCYRFLGSLGEAEEAAQETALRAWRARDTFRGGAAVRTWLHRIATRVCLDLLDQRRRRPAVRDLGPPSDPEQPPAPPLGGTAWVEPLPESFLVDLTQDPAARYTLRESVSLAFLAAVQSLPPRQRAVLVLRDVLAWSAAEVASALGMSVAAVNSALHRARTVLRDTHHRSGIDAMAAGPTPDPGVRSLVDAYVRAWEADDVQALVAVLAEDVRLAMPPSPTWYAGRAAVAGFIDRWVLRAGPPDRFRLDRTQANGAPAVRLLERQPGGGWEPVGLQVLTVGPGGIAAIAAYMDPAVVARFDPVR